LRGSCPGAVPAHDRSEAERLARVAAKDLIKQEYPGGELLDDTLTVSVWLDPPEGIGRTSVRVTLLCPTLCDFDAGLRLFDQVSLFPNKKIVDCFDTELQVHGTGDDRTISGRIKTTGRGTLRETTLTHAIWEGELVDDDEPVNLNLSLKSTDHTTWYPPKAIDVGSLRLTLTQTNGRLNLRATAGTNAVRLPGPRRGIDRPDSQARFRLKGRDDEGNEMVYDVFVSVSNPAQYMASWYEEVQRITLALQDRPEELSVYDGRARVKVTYAGGRVSEIGRGWLFIVCNNETVAQEYVQANFPERSDVRIAHDLQTARQQLETEWKESRASQCNQGRLTIVDGTEKIELRVKTDANMGDKLPWFKNRIRGSR